MARHGLGFVASTAKFDCGEDFLSLNKVEVYSAYLPSDFNNRLSDSVDLSSETYRPNRSDVLSILICTWRVYLHPSAGRTEPSVPSCQDHAIQMYGGRKYFASTTSASLIVL
ncbi:hypothetical protein QCA50_007256 [Cerrena zonata]|uniref:Uncharacterized protein n=1 Tax=Cerrena zonata TaxID=2478898 RepID=A0AAW0GDN8_9APHY